MKICTFFGHRDAPESIRYDLKRVLIELIENKGVSLFYVGNNGKFDSIVKTELELFSSVYTHIDYYVVTNTVPEEGVSLDEIISKRLLVPGGFEKIPKRFTVDYRNRWMLNQSDYVVTYVWKAGGGARKFKELAERKKKNIINLYKEE